MQVHLSLGEILGDLESKDLQLTLAMQDLSIATEEIKKAAEFRSLLASLEKYICSNSTHFFTTHNTIGVHMYTMYMHELDNAYSC